MNDLQKVAGGSGKAIQACNNQAVTLADKIENRLELVALGDTGDLLREYSIATRCS